MSRMKRNRVVIGGPEKYMMLERVKVAGAFGRQFSESCSRLRLLRIQIDELPGLSFIVFVSSFLASLGRRVLGEMSFWGNSVQRSRTKKLPTDHRWECAVLRLKFAVPLFRVLLVVGSRFCSTVLA